MIWPALIVVGLLGAWELYADFGGVEQLILPAPHAVASALWVDRSLMWSNYLVTASEILLGIGLAALVGFACDARSLGRRASSPPRSRRVRITARR